MRIEFLGKHRTLIVSVLTPYSVPNDGSSFHSVTVADVESASIHPACALT